MTTAEQAAVLRKPFPREVIGQLPRIWCNQCSEANKNRRGTTCEKHTKVKCRVCNNNITEAHLHLDYVGHAETTDRLLSADPDWTWEPMAFGDDGLPKFDTFGGLWIKLTVCGTTRPGYGDAQGKKGADAIKEAIGDAIRNAAQRFGVALDLWGATYKGSSDDNDPDPQDTTDSRNSSEDWEQATTARPSQQRPTPSREEVIEKAHAAIAAATSVDALAPLKDLVDERTIDGPLSTEDAQDLYAVLNARAAELQGDQSAADDAAPADAAPIQPVAAPGGDPMPENLKRRMFALFFEIGLRTRNQQVEYLSRFLHRQIEHRDHLTAGEARQIISAIEDEISLRADAAKANGAKAA